jgi:predicted nucleotidyltransferase
MTFIHGHSLLRSTDKCARYSGRVSDPATDATGRLFGAAESGELARVCVRVHVALMVLFGSAAQGTEEPRDVDLAVRFERGVPGDVLTMLDDLYQLTGYEGFDVLDLDRAGPLARERALVGGRLLYQERDGLFATTQIAAIMERMDTDEMRRVALELLSG